MRSLQEKSSALFHELNSLSSSSLLEAKNARELSDFLRESASKLLAFKTSVDKIIKNKMRQESLKVSAPAPISVCDAPPGPSLKSQVMSEHSKKVAKVKTRGTPDDRDLQHDLGSSETNEEPEIQENNIASFVGVAKDIFDGNDENIRDFPKELISTARDKLHLLSRCKNIKELETNLPGSAHLKKLSGDSTTWQFRINDAYRVRFTLGDHKFLNVNVGDFH
jgi:plasmid maintenance system killer protein